MKIASIVGARPQFIKIAPLVRAIQEHNQAKPNLSIDHLIIHTGQHYDYNMNKIFFDDLKIPEPDYNLEVGSGSHGWQTAEMMKRAEDVLLKEKPDWVIVYGDTNSTLAGALAATKIHISLAHIEAGLRSYNKRMPEEMNRVLTDHCSDILFCPTENAVKNLKKEGFTKIINNGKLIDSSTQLHNNQIIQLSNNQSPVVINVGDIMYDAFLMSLKIAETKSTILEKLELKPKEYYLATIHRAENTDNMTNLSNIFKALVEISKDMQIIMPLHPRTKKSIESLTLSLPNSATSLRIIAPVSYFDILMLEKNAKIVLTDSGGMQKESYFLKVPCITLRNETEWTETTESDWNIVVGTKKVKILENIKNYDNYNGNVKKRKPFFGQGKSGEVIINILKIL